jgi:manganese/zinc/iron transport system permease protein
MESLFAYFTDAVLRAPTLGCMLMGLSAGLVGAIAVLRKEALVGEALSHAAYPGLIVGLALAGMLPFVDADESISSLLALMGGTITSLVGIWIIHWLERSLRVPIDAALCFVLAATFGVGITLASHLQFTNASIYRRTLVLLYGQAATMTDFHVYLYGILALVVSSSIALFYKEIQLITFDREYALSLGVPVRAIEVLLFALIAITVIIGIRTVGVVLMSAMLIAPPVAARQFSDRLGILLLISASIGMLAAFGGNYLSVEISQYFSRLYPGSRLALPTGPMIALMAAFLCLTALLIAPQRGIVARGWRILRFRYSCLQENILKCIWRQPGHSASIRVLADYLGASHLALTLTVWRLTRQGWLVPHPQQQWHLTPDGEAKAAKIVRLHRLWEVYLADYLGIGAERVHRSAEEMEHIITPQLETALTQLLADPKQDPHHQPIPPAQVRW